MKFFKLFIWFDFVSDKKKKKKKKKNSNRINQISYTHSNDLQGTIPSEIGSLKLLRLL